MFKFLLGTSHFCYSPDDGSGGGPPAPKVSPFAKGASDGGSSGDEGASGAGEGDEGTKTPTGGVGQGEGDDDADGEPMAIARPDHIPEKFWDKKNNKLNEEGLLKSYSELEKELTKAKEPPKAPDNYTYKVPENLTKEYGVKEISAEDPYMQAFGAYAKENGFTQEQYQGFIDWYMKMEMDHMHKQQVAEWGKLGNEETAIKRVKTINTFAKNKLSKESAAAIIGVAQSAEVVKAIEELITQASKGRNTVNEDTDIDDALTEDQVNAMMKDERYWDSKHPEHATFVAKVTKEYQRLYPEKKR